MLGLAAGLDSDSAALDAEVLLCHCLDKPRSWLYTWPEKNVDPAIEARYRELMARRAAGHPVAHLTGRRDFWSLELEVTADTLIPRPDTETLVAWALELPLPDIARVADLGTGSGAIALALATERPRWAVTATDASAAALAVAGRNAERLCPGRVRLLEGSWFAPLAGERFDLVVSNPPYVEAGDRHLARGDVRFEPRSALAAGPEGLDDLSHIARNAPAYILPGGYLLLEHGCDQGEPVRALLRQAGFEAVNTRRDLGGLERITGGRRRAQ
nr:peptide chain release factor N(5)-glutamine methyltransferase [Parahaliea mediterranea]